MFTRVDIDPQPYPHLTSSSVTEGVPCDQFIPPFWSTISNKPLLLGILSGKPGWKIHHCGLPLNNWWLLASSLGTMRGYPCCPISSQLVILATDTAAMSLPGSLVPVAFRTRWNVLAVDGGCESWRMIKLHWYSWLWMMTFWPQLHASWFEVMAKWLVILNVGSTGWWLVMRHIPHGTLGSPLWSLGSPAIPPHRIPGLSTAGGGPLFDLLVHKAFDFVQVAIPPELVVYVSIMAPNLDS